MNDHSNQWQAVANALALRMPEVDIFDTATLARRSGLSEPFVRNLLTGEPRGAPRPGNLIKLCRAVQWTDDSIGRLLRGEPPESLNSPGDAGAAPELAARVAVLEAGLAGALTGAVGRAGQVTQFAVDQASWAARVAVLEAKVEQLQSQVRLGLPGPPPAVDQANNG